MNNKFDLTGKVAVVTGASTEIGEQAAIAYAQAGADVALLAENTEGLKKVKAEIEKMGRRAIAVQCEVTNEESVKAAVRTILDSFEKIDILLNNSNITLVDELENMTDVEWNKSFGAILRSAFFASKYVIPQMKKRSYGKIVNVSSANSRVPERTGRWLSAPKDTVAELTRNLATLYSQYGISVNTVGLENADEFSGNVLYLSSDESNVVRGKFIGAGCAAIA